MQLSERRATKMAPTFQLLWLALAITLIVFPPVASLMCGPGTHVQINSADPDVSSCEPCPQYEFNNETSNRTECFSCTLVHHYSVYYTVVSECNATMDAIVKCKGSLICQDNYLPQDPCRPCKNRTGGDTSSTQSPATGEPKQREKCVAAELKEKNSPFTFRSLAGCHDGETYICDFDNETIVCIPCRICDKERGTGNETDVKSNNETDGPSENNERKWVLPLAITVAVLAILIIGILVVIIFRLMKKRPQQNNQVDDDDELAGKNLTDNNENRESNL